jgi:hypothetical protein
VLVGESTCLVGALMREWGINQPMGRINMSYVSRLIDLVWA